jgi:hypothetical protein
LISPRTYGLTLATAGLAVTLGLMAFALWLIPVTGMTQVGAGDLTRVGWFSNNNYGNRTPQLVFQPPLFALRDVPDRHYDVVIVGDSFSMDPEKSWPNHLAARGLSVLVIPVTEDLSKENTTADVERQIRALLETPAFRQHPPGVFVFESVERFLRRRLVNDAAPCVDERPAQPREPNAAEGTLPLQPPILEYGTPPTHRLERMHLPPAGRYDEEQLTYARDFLVKNVRRMFGWQGDGRELALRTPRFSSRKPDRLLVVAQDLRKQNWTDADLAQMRCQLLKLQEAVQANGKTLFVALPIPDKLSAYHADLVDRNLPAGIVERIDDPRLNRPQVEKPIRAAIDAGEIDVYLPNDTHFSTRGHALTAETVLDFIEARTQRIGVPQARADAPK